MTREIKFRGWDRKAKAMFPVHHMTFGAISNELNHISGVDIHNKDSDSSGDVFYGGNVHKKTGNPLLPQFELMQFTGLMDKNGKEIYESDVIDWNGIKYKVCIGEFSVMDIDSEEKVDVVYGVYGSPIGEDSKPFCNDMQINSVWIKHQEIVVIGNVHANPEMLNNGAQELRKMADATTQTEHEDPQP